MRYGKKLLAAQVGWSILFVSGCGGGGGSGSTDAGSTVTALPATINVLAAYTAFLGASRTFSLSGSTSTGTSLTATLSTAPGSKVTSEAGAFDSSTTTVAIFRGSTLASNGVSTYWMKPGSPNAVYQFQSADGSCIVSQSSAALPTSAILNQSGPYLAGPKFTGCSSSNLPRTTWVSTDSVTQTWSYQAIGGIAFVCINSSVKGFFGTSIESDCIEVLDASGTLGPHARVTTTDLNGVTTTLSN